LERSEVRSIFLRDVSGRSDVSRSTVNRITLILPLVLSALAFALVMISVLSGVPPQPDENASAHIWQLLMAAQLPLVVLFLATADWRSWSPALLFGLQVAAIAAACAPVWLAGY
jgi:hypothetical protein